MGANVICPRVTNIHLVTTARVASIQTIRVENAKVRWHMFVRTAVQVSSVPERLMLRLQMSY